MERRGESFVAGQQPPEWARSLGLRNGRLQRSRLQGIRTEVIAVRQLTDWARSWVA